MVIGSLRSRQRSRYVVDGPVFPTTLERPYEHRSFDEHLDALPNGSF